MTFSPAIGPAGAPKSASKLSPKALAEIVFLLLLPVLAYFCLHFKPLMQNRSLDPFFYTGYINNFHDLVQRYGLNYYNVRFGLIFPARALTAIFGPEPGFFAFRYALALILGIPLYLVVRRFLSLPVAIVTYAAVMTSPFTARILLWDHPDASGVPYLTAAICILLLETRSRSWDFVAGCFAALAAHSNIFTVAIFGIFIGVYGALWLIRKKGAAALARRLLLLAAAGAAVTAPAIVYYWIVVGHPNIFYPTLDNVFSLSLGGMEKWRYHGAGWTLSQIHVFVPVWLALSCIAAYALRRGSFPVAAVTCYGAATTAFYYAHQFLLKGDSLQLPYYFSYAAPAIFLMLAILLQVLWDAARVRSTPFIAVALASLALPWLALWSGVDIFSHGALSLFLLSGGVALAGIVLAMRLRRSTAATATALAAAVLLGAGFDSGLSTYRGIVEPRSSTDTSDIDVYRVALQLIRAMPRSQDKPGELAFWYDGQREESLNSLSSVYLWRNLNADPDPQAPELNQREVARLKSGAVRYLSLLGESREDIQRETEALRRRQVEFREAGRRVLGSGGYRAYWTLLELTPAGH